MTLRDAYIALGSNVGDREELIYEALRALETDPRVWVETTSKIYETDAVGPPQPNYLNAVAKVKTELDPRSLLHLCLQIECDLGRVRSIVWGPRSMDLDLIWVDSLQINEPDIALPHPGLADRDFVLVPLFDVAPQIVEAIRPDVVSFLDQGKTIPEIHPYNSADAHTMANPALS